MRDRRDIRWNLIVCLVVALVAVGLATPGSQNVAMAADPTPSEEPSEQPSEEPEPEPEPSEEPSEQPSEEPEPEPEPSEEPSEEPEPSEQPSDANGDGIADSLQPGATPFGSFSDETLSPATVGSIVSNGGLSVTIVDAPSALEGVQVATGSGGPGAQATLDTCGGFALLVDADSIVTVTCGSVTVRVAQGGADVVLGGGITVVAVPAGGAATVADIGGGSFEVENAGEAGSPSITLTVDGETTTVEVGQPTVAGTSDFIGYSHPIDADPVLNRVKSGQAIPIKWRLLSSTGLPITDLSTAVIKVSSLDCSLGATVDQMEEVVAGASGLLNLGNGYYQVNWKPPKTYGGSCKTMHLTIGDGVTHDALFQFTK